MKKATINVTVKLVPHPDPQRLTNMWARLIVKEILRREAEAAIKPIMVSAVSTAQKKIETSDS